MMNQTPSPPERLAYSVREAAGLIGLSVPTVWRRISSGELVAVRIGSRTLIRDSDLRAFLDNLSPARQVSA